MYKLNFPLDEYKRVNSLLTNYFTEYIYRDGWIYGTSINNWSFHLVKIDAKVGKHIENLLIPPNHMRSVLGDLKKTKTYIPSSDIEFKIYTFDDKIKEDEPDISKGIVVLSVGREPRGSKTMAGKRMDSIEDKASKFRGLLDLYQSFDKIELEDIVMPFSNDAPCEFIEPQTGDVVLLTREMFPNYKKINSVSWQSIPINDDFSWAVYKVQHEAGTVYTFVKYIRQFR